MSCPKCGGKAFHIEGKARNKKTKGGIPIIEANCECLACGHLYQREFADEENMLKEEQLSRIQMS